MSSREIPAWVVSVHDGDTVKVETVRGDPRSISSVRFSGADAPELKQLPFGPVARDFVSERAPPGSQVLLRLDPTGAGRERDRYRRLIADIYPVSSDGTRSERSLQEQLLAAGLAWHYKAYDSRPELAVLEAEARRTRSGLWSNPVAANTPPWDWRHRPKSSRVRRHRKRVTT